MITFKDRFQQLIDEDFSGSQAKLAKHLGFSPQRISLYTKGERSPDIETLLSICEKCDVSVSWLLGTSAVKVPDERTQAAAKITGLSERAVKELVGPLFAVPEMKNLLSALISSHELLDALRNIILARNAQALDECYDEAEDESSALQSMSEILASIGRLVLSGDEAVRFFKQEAKSAFERFVDDQVDKPL